MKRTSTYKIITVDEMSIKLKSLLKIACYATAVVILCYLEGKYSLFTRKTEKSGMTSLKILTAEFEVFGRVQGELWPLSKVSTFTF